jgi:hypothetical protein
MAPSSTDSVYALQCPQLDLCHQRSESRACFLPALISMTWPCAWTRLLCLSRCIIDELAVLSWSQAGFPHLVCSACWFPSICFYGILCVDLSYVRARRRERGRFAVHIWEILFPVISIFGTKFQYNSFKLCSIWELFYAAKSTMCWCCIKRQVVIIMFVVWMSCLLVLIAPKRSGELLFFFAMFVSGVIV